MVRYAKTAMAGIGVMVASVSMLVSTAAAEESTYPNRPIVIVVPFTAGAGTDVSARSVSKALTELTGQPVVVENRPGGNNAIGVRQVINASPDGYTLLIGTNSPVAGNVALFKALPYDPVEQLTPVAPLSRQDWTIVVNRDSPYRTLDELIAAGRKDPMLLSAGAGAAGYQLASLLLAKNTKTEVNLIPYPGTPPAIQDLLGGRLSFVIVDAGSVLPHIKSGSLRPLAMLADQRVNVLPDVPTLKELGYPSIPLMSWAGIFAPKNTPPAVVDKLAGLIEQALSTEALQRYYEGIGADIVTGGASVLSKMQRNDIDNYRNAMSLTGLPQL